MARHHVIYIPGLADRLNRRLGQATALLLWRLNGLRTHYFVVGWADQDESFDHKLERLLQRIDRLKAKGHTVSLVASSAGASLALLALHERSNDLKAVVTICAFLRDPEVTPDLLYAANPALKVSMQRFQAIEPQISPAERAKILSVEPLKDAVVPVGEMHIKGTAVEQIPARGHLRGIFGALTLYRERLIKFIRQSGR